MKTSVGNIKLNPKIKCFLIGHDWRFCFEIGKRKCLRCGVHKY